MLFNSSDYIFFLVIVVAVQHVIPWKIRPLWLLGASWYFYMQWNPKYIFLMHGTILITYFAGLLIERKHDKRILFASIFILIIVLAVYKYLGFFAEIINTVLGIFKGDYRIDSYIQLVLPVGISFFTLQSIGYVIDVWRGEYRAEHNFVFYALFISFFPQLVAGPIERSENLLPQLKQKNALTWDMFRKGILLILYGFFCKMVIADRLALIVDDVYGNPEHFGGLWIVIATGAFAFQIYCDFYGYSTIARGSALLLGVKLVDNFNAPYLAKSVKEFWRRWHISLSYWFRDYVYIPLGGNRKGFKRKESNLLFVFSLSGLWHGASVTFIIWGFLNGLYQVIRDVINRLLLHRYNDKKISGGATSWHMGNLNRLLSVFTGVLKRIVLFFMISVTWFFFRVGNLSEAKRMVGCIFPIEFNRNLLRQLAIGGSLKVIFPFLIFCLGIMLIVDIGKYRNIEVAEYVIHRPWIVRTVCFVGLFVLIVLFGCYGETYETEQFIYFQF